MSLHRSEVQVEINEITAIEVFFTFHKTVRIEEVVKVKNDHPLTVYPTIDCVPKSDALKLKEYLDCGDEEGIYHLVTKRSCPQRLQIRYEYENKLSCEKVNLIQVLKHKLSGDFRTLIVALFTPSSEYIASELHHAITGLVLNEETIIEILCTLTNEQKQLVIKAYQKLYHKSLENAVCEVISGTLRELLISLITRERSETEKVDMELVEKDVSELIASGICPGANPCQEVVIFEILALRSYAHLCEVFKLFREIAQCSVQTVIEKKFKGNVLAIMLATIRVFEDINGYFAERLKNATAGWGTKDRQMIRLIVTRCEVDLKRIKEVYLKLYNVRLEDDIADDTSGSYRKALLCLVQGNE